MRKGAKFTDEHRQKISTKLKGRKLSETHKENMSKAKKGKISNCAKSVKIIYKHIEYNFSSMTEAEKYFWEEMQLKVFYWLRRDIPKKYIDDVQLVQIGDYIRYQKFDEELKNIG